MTISAYSDSLDWVTSMGLHIKIDKLLFKRLENQCFLFSNLLTSCYRSHYVNNTVQFVPIYQTDKQPVKGIEEKAQYISFAPIVNFY